MTARERFRAAMDFRPATPGLAWEFGYWGGTLERWYREGLPRAHPLPRAVTAGEGICGPGHGWPVPSMDPGGLRDGDVSAFFGFDEGIVLPPANWWLAPRYERVVLREDAETIELLDTDGVRKVARRDGTSIPLMLAWPVSDRASWDRLRAERLRTDDIVRRLGGERAAIRASLAAARGPVGLLGDPVGFFGSLRFLMGEVNLFLAYYDQPDLLRDMIDRLGDLWLALCEELLPLADWDAAFFWEDMSGCQGSLVSPAVFREFMLPAYRRLVGFLRQHGVRNFFVDTDGRVDELVPLFLEAGMTGMYPFEVQAGNDIREYRERYPRLQILGGLDKRALAAGPAAIDREVGKAAAMLSRGGYVPFADHLVPPDVSWENFSYYRRSLAAVLQRRVRTAQ